MSEAKATIEALSKPFDRGVIQTKPGSARKPPTEYVSHGSCTKRLNAVCPDWSSRVVAMHTYMDQQGRMQCAGVTLELTIPGVGSREEFGAASTPRDFGTDAKNAMSDALKRCAMRFGVAIDLWEEMDEDNDPEAQRFDAAPQPANQPARQRAASVASLSASPTDLRPAVAPSGGGPPPSTPEPPYTDREFNAITDKAWGWAEDGWKLDDVRNDLNKLRHRMSKKQRQEVVTALAKIEAEHYTAVSAPDPHPPEPSHAGEPGQQRATERQVKFIRAIAQEAGLDAQELAAWSLELYQQDVEHLNRRDAGTLIEALQRRRNEVA